MARKNTETQEESRSEVLTMRLTPTEKTAVRVVAGVKGVEESNLLRSITLEDVMREFGRIKAAA